MRTTKLFFVQLALLAVLVGKASAAPSVMAAPQRMVFDSGERSASITLINSGDENGVFRIELINLELNEKGILQPRQGEVPAAEDYTRYFRISPRQAVLAPGERQVIRVIARRPKDLAPGEYVAGLRIVPYTEPHKEMQPDAGGNKMSINIAYRIANVLPLFLRHTELEGGVEVEGVALDQQGALEVTLARKGQRSIYALMKAYFTPDGGRESDVGDTIITLYPGGDHKQAGLKVQLPEGYGLQQGVLRLELLDMEERRKGTRLGGARFRLQ